MSAFGKLFKEARLKAKVTQRHIASAMGVTPSAISQWETGDTLPDAERLFHLSNMLGLNHEAMSAAIAQDSREAGAAAAGAYHKSLPPMPAVSVFQRGEGMPLFATHASADGQGFQIADQVVDMVHRPPRLQGREDVFALFMRGTEMSPWREPGDLVVIDRNRPPRVGDYVLLTMKRKGGEGRWSLIRRLVEGRAHDIRVEQFKPAKEEAIKLEEIEDMLRIADWTELMLGS